MRQTINSFLSQSYNFRIDHTYNIKGDEGQIRLFFLRYYLEVSPLEEWPFKDYLKKASIFNFICSVFKPFNFTDESILYCMTILVVINYIREKQGFSLMKVSKHYP
uniref:helix-turn-helix domain-containing protein n=1 Tax=Streptococcus uberis TaxID=1349 RepID=UPI003CCFE418